MGLSFDASFFRLEVRCSALRLKHNEKYTISLDELDSMALMQKFGMCRLWCSTVEDTYAGKRP